MLNFKERRESYDGIHHIECQNLTAETWTETLTFTDRIPVEMAQRGHMERVKTYVHWYVFGTIMFCRNTFKNTEVLADHSGRSKTGIVSSNPTEGMDVRVDSVYVCM
jgi:hypothetical protein